MLSRINLLILSYLCFKIFNFANKKGRKYGKKGLIRGGSKVKLKINSGCCAFVWVYMLRKMVRFGCKFYPGFLNRYMK
jgi:hypothetical protein